ncbi:MAG TPA: carboxypeptidase-like regulatory domain-containing protein, partial [Puia sp.]|nr:carboxypeptidase-like regulatory domain-containing protein [Puia sp.]
MNYFFIIRRPLFLLLLLVTAAGYGQTPSVSGTVLDDYGHPLGGVIIHVKGRNATVFSGADGTFHIDAAAGGKLVFEHPRYEVREWRVRGGQPTITMAERPLHQPVKMAPEGDTIYLQLMKPERI